MRTCFLSFSCLLLLLEVTPAVLAQVPYSATPTWTSTSAGAYSTGAAWSDINNDGWLDLVIADGNDMDRQHVVVYYNDGAGNLPLTPDWQSTDVDYHGHLAVGDVNRDGLPDVAVSVYLGPAGFQQKGRVKLYLNTGAGLSPTPSWVSSDSMYTFSCAFGDADGDGDPDLAVAAGESYYLHPEQGRIYFNHNGVLNPLPEWKSRTAVYSYDVGWEDFDNDGDLDLVFGNEYGPNQVFRNDLDSITTLPVWTSKDGGQSANSLFTGDVNNDGLADLAVSDNSQLGGSGRFKMYHNGAGTLDTIPFWLSSFSGYGSGITLADVDNDGDKDLMTGGWWEPCRIYLNGNGVFPTSPSWVSATGSVVEAIVFGDVDQDGLDTLVVKYPGNGVRKLFRLPKSPVHYILQILTGSGPLSVNEYCTSLENGWVSLGSAPGPADTLTIRYSASHDLDFAVSNWDPGVGNYVFRNTSHPVAVALREEETAGSISLSQYPNPFNGLATFDVGIGQEMNAGRVRLRVYDVIGREVATLLDGSVQVGSTRVAWEASAFASGLYVYRLEVLSYGPSAAAFVKSGKMLLMR